MKSITATLFLFFCLNLSAAGTGHYKILEGDLHRKGTATIKALPDPRRYKVQMEYKVEKKTFAPIPSKFLKGKTVYEFPKKFKTEAGYKDLEKNNVIETEKAFIQFVKRGNEGRLKGVYFFEIHPKNKKSKIFVTYHPTAKGVGWTNVKIKFISEIPVLDGYELEAELK